MRLGLIIEEIGFAPVEPEIPGFPTATFLEHDLDADGVLSITEVPAEQVPNFDLIDRNQDGVVSRTEVVRWIEAGAPYEEFWAFVPPTKPAPPEVKNRDCLLYTSPSPRDA